ncbi:hydroxyacid dehydrogenase [Cupriavidus sp. 30B13]|uniref:hydroxyacid dehydrogenase n=1 Tax=Cupriavidus sp. 30B13 TaxID=3384241 RepID=UPI003B90D4C5
MTRPVILCTLPMHASGAALLAPVAELVVAPDTGADTLRRMVRDADYLLVRSHLPADLFDGAPRLKGVVRNGTGLDMIPVEAATALGIPVANVPGANAQAVAEYCIGAFLALARRFGAMDAALRGAGWAEARALSAPTVELAGKTAGIVGLGNIGGRLARICAEAFGMTVLASQPGEASLPAFATRATLDDLLRQSDFVSLNCPLTPQTHHLLDEARLRAMKPTAFLVNAARGEVVDEAALARALGERWIAGAALDVFARQPLARAHPLLALDNVILTPHAASLTQESSEKMSTGAARQLLQLMAGERPEFLVNPQAWDGHASRRHAMEVQRA